MSRIKLVILKRRITIFCVTLLLLCNVDIAFSQNDGFWARAEKILITPQTPIPMSGYKWRKKPFKGVHDDIYARVVAVSDGNRKALVISAEVIGFSNSFWEECTALITQKTGIPKEYILLTAVHNHNGPSLRVYNAEEDLPEVNDYIGQIETKIVQATVTAVNNLSPATIGAGKGICKMNINRVASNGKGIKILGRNPYGPCDHEVGVIRINNTSGDPVVVMVNWPCHGVVLGPNNKLITGDWPGAAAGYVEKGLGKEVIAPITIGASGDINPIYGPHIDFEINSSYAFGKDAIGEDLGNEAIRVADHIRATSNGKIKALQRVISLPLKDEIREANNLQQPESVENDSLQVRLSAMKIGNIVLAGVSGEVFNQISVKMRNLSPYTNTFMLTHCNGSCGYLVTDEAYVIGGYEARSTNAKSGAEKEIVENLLEMIWRL